MDPPPDRLPTTWMLSALGNGPPAPIAAATLSSHISAPSKDATEKVPPPEGAMVTGPARVGASSAAYCEPFCTQPPNPQLVGALMTWKWLEVKLNPPEVAAVRMSFVGPMATSSKVITTAGAGNANP